MIWGSIRVQSVDEHGTVAADHEHNSCRIRSEPSTAEQKEPRHVA